MNVLIRSTSKGTSNEYPQHNFVCDKTRKNSCNSKYLNSENLDQLMHMQANQDHCHLNRQLDLSLKKVTLSWICTPPSLIGDYFNPTQCGDPQNSADTDHLDRVYPVSIKKHCIIIKNLNQTLCYWKQTVQRVVVGNPPDVNSLRKDFCLQLE